MSPEAKQYRAVRALLLPREELLAPAGRFAPFRASPWCNHVGAVAAFVPKPRSPATKVRTCSWR